MPRHALARKFDQKQAVPFTDVIDLDAPFVDLAPMNGDLLISTARCGNGRHGFHRNRTLAEVLATLPTCGPDVAKNRAEAREIMKKLGYGPDKRLAVTVTTRNVGAYRDPTVLLIDQLKEIYIDGVLDAVDTTQWYPKVMRKDYTVGVTVGENGLDDPDQQFYENYACGSERNYTGYCNADTDKLIDRQSMEADPGKRKQIVWEIEKRLAEDGARPIIFYPVSAACWQPQFKGHQMMVNGNYNGWRLEDAWLDN
jgi:peptide/nickel transport system substrate-binding protein